MAHGTPGHVPEELGSRPGILKEDGSKGAGDFPKAATGAFDLQEVALGNLLAPPPVTNSNSTVSGPATSELAKLGGLLGAQCVDAEVVESAVIDRCDTAVDLQRRRAELANANSEVCRIEGRLRIVSPSEPAGSGVGTGTAGAETLRLTAELTKARGLVEHLRAEVQRLERKAKAQQETRHELTALKAAAPAAPASSVAPAAPAPAARWGRLKSAGSNTTTVTSLCFDDDEDEDDVKLTPQPRKVSAAAAEAEASPTPTANTTASASEPVSGPRIVNGVLIRPRKNTSPSPTSPQKRRAPGTTSKPKSTSSTKSTSTSQSAGGKDKKGADPEHAEAKRAVKKLDEAAAVSAREYLSRFQSKVAKVGAAVSTAPGQAPPESQSQRLQRAATVFRAAQSMSTLTANDSGSAVDDQSGQPDPEVAEASAVKEEELSEEEELFGSSQLLVPLEDNRKRAKYSIDVNQLIPRAAQDANRWKEFNAAEWRAYIEQGEGVSPHQNLLRRGFGVKRKQVSGEAGSKQKLRRGSDTNEKAYLRRQVSWQKLGREPSAALMPKQSVDEVGGVVPKEEGEGAGLDASAGSRQDDVRVGDGLRCPRWLWEALYPYQHECVRWLWGLHQQKLGGILADEMGLGKTVQMAAYLAVLHHSGVLQRMRVQNTSLGVASPAETGGVLIVAPATLVTQWRSELNLWYPPLRVCLMHQVNDQERKQAIHVATSQNGVLITSYETMRIFHEELLESPWVMVVLDEGQKIRNPDANITLAAKRFSTPHRIILSGSPIQNNLQELWSLFDFICPGRLGTLPVFMEEFAQPIQQGNLVGANQTRVATAYQCALALRELTQPCVLRRTKAECMDVLQLPHKQEQVLFCHLTPEQYQVYIDFLQTEQVRRALTAAQDRKNVGAIFFSISVLRKLCNHPDLLLKDADKDMQPPDMWSFERSGKMKVLAEIMKLWRTEGHRALIFVQTVQMLEVIQSWMKLMGYTHLRIDGKTPVKQRLKLIDEFNANTDFFAMVLTTRVGGVGLNIVGADRVVIFDPDWNPMTDVQARERAWRIGQRRDVAVYRLVLTGSIEEKVYQRQVYKHFLSQKVLSDPRQRQFFKWNDMADLFDIPPVPPDFDPQAMLALREKYKSLFRKFDKAEGDKDVETTDVMQAISEMPTSVQNMPSKEVETEHNAILQTLYDANGIKASFNHDKVEQPLLDRKIVRDGANLIARRALAALQESSRERANHHISEPTWTGQRGTAGAGAAATSSSALVKREPDTYRDRDRERVVSTGQLAGTSGVSSEDILSGLRQLAAIRALAEQRNPSQSVRPVREGLWPKAQPAAPATPIEQAPDTSQLALVEAADRPGLPTELHASDRKIAEMILKAFLNRHLAGSRHRLTTGQVLETLASRVAPHHNDLFKSLLKQLCELSAPSHPGEPGVWTLRPEFWPN